MRQPASRFFHAPAACVAAYASDMAGEEKKPMSVDNPVSKEPPVRDLADFHVRWREFRNKAMNARDNAALGPEERETIAWLIRMADRIGRSDLE
jgi:hypothetical protein